MKPMSILAVAVGIVLMAATAHAQRPVDEIQAPRRQDVQAPRGQDVQAPRGQDVQAPRG